MLEDFTLAAEHDAPVSPSSSLTLAQIMVWQLRNPSYQNQNSYLF